MKKYISFLITAGLPVFLSAQPPYPNPLPVPANLTQLEYFINTDPGVGNGKPVTIPAGTDINALSFQADLTGLPSGFHRIFLRSRNADGSWSLCANLQFTNVAVPAYPTASTVSNMGEVEYFIDSDPGLGNGQKITLPASPNVSGQNIAINISGLAIGVHRLFIRSRGLDGKWSLTNFSLFDNLAQPPYPSAPAPAAPVSDMEYYIDTDPGFGNGTAVAVTASAEIAGLVINVPLNGIAPGPHTLYIRSRQNPWSFSAYAPFLFSGTLPLDWLYVKGMIDQGKAQISWGTASEKETDRFQVEHSVNGRSFAVAGELPATGSNGSSEQYSFSHAGLQNGMNYYRIKQLDKDGRFSYSQVITLLYRDNLAEIMVAPNPVADQLHIIQPQNKRLIKLEIVNLAGNLVLNQPYQSAQQVYTVGMGRLPAGNYVVKLYYEKEIKSYKIVKQ